MARYWAPLGINVEVERFWLVGEGLQRNKDVEYDLLAGDAKLSEAEELQGLVPRRPTVLRKVVDDGCW